MIAPVDVLAVMLAGQYCPRMQPKIARELGEARAAVADLIEAIETLLEASERPPERNCSCHISPPCSDCVEWGVLRGRFAYLDTALARCKGDSP